MQNLIIIGAGGYGRETYHLAQMSCGYGETFVVKGFLDDNSSALEPFDDYPPVLGSVSGYTIQTDDVFACAIGSIKPKIACIRQIQERGGVFINLIHRDAMISPASKLGTGLIINAGVSISCDTEIGNFVSLQAGCILGHDVRVGEFVHMHPRVFLGGGVTVGEGAHLFPYAIIHPYKRLGNYTNVGAGAFVIRNVKDGTSVYGNPAKKLS